MRSKLLSERTSTSNPGLPYQKTPHSAIGFTPTDALHVLGEYTAWNEDASRTRSEKLARIMRMTPMSSALP
jgi:N-methylhydantoinase A/oxoprolinase/acetone carboxylase beta subunit